MQLDNKYILKLDLPKPPKELVDHIYKMEKMLEEMYPNGEPTTESNAVWNENFNHGQRKIIWFQYSTKLTEYSQEQNQMIDDIYGPYFKSKCRGMFALMKNRYPGSVSHTPIHTDRGRNIAVNWILETGGTEVMTTFYNKERRQHPVYHKRATNYRIDQVEQEYSVKLPKETWIAFNVQKVHSVENISTTRKMFSIIIEDNPSWYDFPTKYSNIIINT